MYYVLSHVPSLIHEFGRPRWQKTELEKLLYFPDRCYEGHHTLYVQFIIDHVLRASLINCHVVYHACNTAELHVITRKFNVASVISNAAA